MPVSARIADQVAHIKQEAAPAEAPSTGRKRRKSTADAAPKAEENGTEHRQPQSTAAVQQLSFDGLEVTADTSLEGVTAARTQRRRQHSRAQKEQHKKRKITTGQQHAAITTSGTTHDASTTSTPPSPPSPTAELLALHQRSQPPSAAEMHRIRNKREKTAISARVTRDTLLATSAAAHHIIEPAPTQPPTLIADGRQSWQLSQDIVRSAVDERTRDKAFELTLDGGGGYRVSYDRGGRHVLMGGAKGHVALMDWKAHRLLAEFDVRESVYDVCFLHSHEMYAVAQRESVYLYDSSGLELHQLKQHNHARALDFLPYHFLLMSIGEGGWLKYHDTSTGTLVSQHRTALGRCDVLTHNPQNAVALCGHSNGTVTLWSPNMREPLVRMLTHKVRVCDVAVDATGTFMVTSGLDGQVKVWDARTYRELHAYFTVRPTTAIDISDAGMLALGFGSHVQVWKDALTTKQSAPYLTHHLPSNQLTSLAFCPFEDVLLTGHTAGLSSLIVPGSGRFTFDSREVAPYENKRMRRERTVVSLLEKLQPSMITLDERLVGMMRGGEAGERSVWEGERRDTRRRREEEEQHKREGKEKMRGGQKSSKRWRRKRTNIIDKQLLDRREAQEKKQQDMAQRKEKEARARDGRDGLPSALDRFTKKR